MALLNVILTGNIFEFNEKLYVQQIGTAMGTKCAPGYANVFMADLEEKKLLGNWNGTPPYMYHRYLDDIFFVWTSSVEELELFLHHINQQHPYSLVLNTSHGTPIQDSLNFPPNSFIPTWSLSRKCFMTTIAPWS